MDSSLYIYLTSEKINIQYKYLVKIVFCIKTEYELTPNVKLNAYLLANIEF